METTQWFVGVKVQASTFLPAAFVIENMNIGGIIMADEWEGAKISLWLESQSRG